MSSQSPRPHRRRSSRRAKQAGVGRAAAHTRVTFANPSEQGSSPVASSSAGSSSRGRGSPDKGGGDVSSEAGEGSSRGHGGSPDKGGGDVSSEASGGGTSSGHQVATSSEPMGPLPAGNVDAEGQSSDFDDAEEEEEGNDEQEEAEGNLLSMLDGWESESLLDFVLQQCGQQVHGGGGGAATAPPPDSDGLSVDLLRGGEDVFDNVPLEDAASDGSSGGSSGGGSSDDEDAALDEEAFSRPSGGYPLAASVFVNGCWYPAGSSPSAGPSQVATCPSSELDASAKSDSVAPKPRALSTSAVGLPLPGSALGGAGEAAVAVRGAAGPMGTAASAAEAAEPTADNPNCIIIDNHFFYRTKRAAAQVGRRHPDGGGGFSGGGGGGGEDDGADGDSWESSCSVGGAREEEVWAAAVAAVAPDGGRGVLLPAAAAAPMDSEPASAGVWYRPVPKPSAPSAAVGCVLGLDAAATGSDEASIRAFDSPPPDLPFLLDEDYLLKRWVAAGLAAEAATAESRPSSRSDFSSFTSMGTAKTGAAAAGPTAGDMGAVPRDVCESRIVLRGFSGAPLAYGYKGVYPYIIQAGQHNISHTLVLHYYGHFPLPYGTLILYRPLSSPWILIRRCLGASYQPRARAAKCCIRLRRVTPAPETPLLHGGGPRRNTDRRADRDSGGLRHQRPPRPQHVSALALPGGAGLRGSAAGVGGIRRWSGFREGAVLQVRGGWGELWWVCTVAPCDAIYAGVCVGGRSAGGMRLLSCSLDVG